MRLGTDRCKDSEMVAIRLLANSNVRKRFSNGKLPRRTIELSVKSMESF